MATYIIEYRVKDISGAEIKTGKTKVKNKTSPIQAQISLEDYLKKKVDGFGVLIVKSCKEDTFSVFEDLFGRDNPFRF